MQSKGVSKQRGGKKKGAGAGTAVEAVKAVIVEAGKRLSGGITGRGPTPGTLAASLLCQAKF